MLTKTQPDEIQDFLADASYVTGGHATGVVFPENPQDVAEVLDQATRAGTQVTVSGAGTGTVGGRVPFGGIIVATNKLNRMTIGRERCVSEAGIRLSELQAAVDAQSLFYPPDPTERSCFLGGTLATNASGARTFKYGPTRNYVERLKIALATGDIIDLRRGENFADKDGKVHVQLASGASLAAQLPSYAMPQVRKHASGYFVAPGMDVIDLFIGSEGTLGVIVEAELKLLPKPAGLLSGVVFFDLEDNLLAFVRDAREQSLASRGSSPTKRGPHASISRGVVDCEGASVDARALEYFDIESLRFLRQKYQAVPDEAVGAIFFEQETTSRTEDELVTQWSSLLDSHHALTDRSWFATNEPD